jgi:hypothetical protein
MLSSSRHHSLGPAGSRSVCSRRRLLRRPEPCVSRVRPGREAAGEVRPQPGGLLGDEEAPESEAQLADRVPVACTLARLPHVVAGARDVQTCSAAQLLRGIIQPGVRPFQSAMACGGPEATQTSSLTCTRAMRSRWLPAWRPSKRGKRVGAAIGTDGGPTGNAASRGRVGPSCPPVGRPAASPG